MFRTREMGGNKCWEVAHEDKPACHELALLAATALTSAADAQEITGAAGSPSATTTIPGNQLLPPPQGAPKDGAFIPLIMQWDENFDIGADTGTPVDDADYQVPFRFTGKLEKLTLKIDRPTLAGGPRETEGGHAQQ